MAFLRIKHPFPVLLLLILQSFISGSVSFGPTGNLRAINPENGFFGVAPGTSVKTNPNAMATIVKNTIFTNVAETSDGGVHWEGMDQTLDEGVTLTSWKNKPWSKDDGEGVGQVSNQDTRGFLLRKGLTAAQTDVMFPSLQVNQVLIPTPGSVLRPDSAPSSTRSGSLRRASPSRPLSSEADDPKVGYLPSALDRKRVWEVLISVCVVCSGVPLVYEAFSWQHGVFVGAAMRSI